MRLNYEGMLRRAGRLKMRGMSLQALGEPDEQWEAIVAFHEAARLEIAALALLAEPSLETTAGARIEASGLLLDGLDPAGAALQWLQIPSDIFATESGQAMVDRLHPVLAREHERFQQAWTQFKATVASPSSLQGAGEVALGAILKKYPGIAGLWWLLACTAFAHSDRETSESAVDRIRQLDPASLRFVARGFATPPVFDLDWLVLDPRRGDFWAQIDRAVEVNITRSPLKVSDGQPSMFGKRLAVCKGQQHPHASRTAAPILHKVA